MSVYAKLMTARIALQNIKLEKTGFNKYSEYYYFELRDFLPTVQQIFSDVGLCGVVSYGVDIATLTITDSDDDKFISITSPMAAANLKGCQPIQNLGAAETYTRRYLWVTAMEIVEHDVIDSGEKAPENKPSALPMYSDDVFDSLIGRWQDAVNDNKTTGEAILLKIKTKCSITPIQEKRILDIKRVCASAEFIDTETGEVTQ